MKKRDSAQKSSGPGAFLADGRWGSLSGIESRGIVHRTVEKLVKIRREGRCGPHDAAEVIAAASVLAAFPNSAQWSGAEHWALAHTNTSAEAAVKYEGRSALAETGKSGGGHWCGERFAFGGERECQDRDRHRAVPIPDGCKSRFGEYFRSVMAVDNPVPVAAGMSDDSPPPAED